MLAASVTGRGSPLLAIDDRLQRTFTGQEPTAVNARPPLTRKEIQARLRAGASVEQVASAAGLPLSRVERLAGPVLSERERLLTEVGRAYLCRPRLGRSALPLGAAVAAAPARAGTRAPAQWTAYRGVDGVWVARLALVMRGRARARGVGL